MMRWAAAACVVLLAACQPSPAPDAKPEPPVAAEAAPAACERVGKLADELFAGKSGGMTEDQANELLRDRQEYALAYVVDGVFRRGVFANAGSDAVARAEIMAACRRGSVY